MQGASGGASKGKVVASTGDHQHSWEVPMACTYDSAAQSNLVGTLALISEISTLRGVERVVHHQHRVPHSQPPASGIGRWHKLWGASSLEGTLSSNVTIKSPMQPQIPAASSGRRAMKSSVVERSSKVSVEDAFWKGLQEIIVKRRDEPLSDRQFANLSSAIRLFALGFYRDEQGGRIA